MFWKVRAQLWDHSSEQLENYCTYTAPKNNFLHALKKGLMVPENRSYQIQYFAKTFSRPLALTLHIHFHLHLKEASRNSSQECNLKCIRMCTWNYSQKCYIFYYWVKVPSHVHFASMKPCHNFFPWTTLDYLSLLKIIIRVVSSVISSQNLTRKIYLPFKIMQNIKIAVPVLTINSFYD